MKGTGYPAFRVPPFAQAHSVPWAAGEGRAFRAHAQLGEALFFRSAGGGLLDVGSI